MTQQVTQELLSLTNGRIVTPSAVREAATVTIDGGHISSLGEETDATKTVDVEGSLIMPGLIDIHGDDIESQLFPRNSPIDRQLALRSTDQATLAAGITTKFHAIAFENSPEENRSKELAKELVERFNGETSLLADHRIHARCELSEAGSVETVCDVLAADVVGLVSLMSHIPGKGQFGSVAEFKDWYTNNYDHTEEQAERVIENRQSVGEDEIGNRIDRVLRVADRVGVPTASHDDRDPQEVDNMADKGVDISEYPLSLAAATRAKERGLWTSMGAPNLVRGGSQWGNLGTAEAIETDTVDMLCVDYHPPSLLAAPFVDTGEPLSKRVARVTKNPADAVGLDNRGRIEQGARADLIVVDPEPTPTVQRVFVEGTEVYRMGAER